MYVCGCVPAKVLRPCSTANPADICECVKFSVIVMYVRLLTSTSSLLVELG